MTAKVIMGLLPTNGIVMGNNAQAVQTAHIEMPGTYPGDSSAGLGSVLGTRVGAHRMYDGFDAVSQGHAFQAGTDVRYSFDSGHTVLWSCSGGGTASATVGKGSGDFYKQIIGGFWDTEIKATYAYIHGNLTFGGAVNQAMKAGNGTLIPGTSYGGNKPQEIIWLGNHEPNINFDGSSCGPSCVRHVGTGAEFAGMMQKYAMLYDDWRSHNGNPTARIKFAACISNPGNNVAKINGDGRALSAYGTTSVNRCNFYGTNTAYDITKNGTRPMDYVGWDIYYPSTEVGGGMSTKSGEVAFATKFGQLHAWTKSQFAGNSTYEIIPEYAIRIPTSPATGSTGPDPTYPATWYTAMRTYLAGAGMLLANGDWCLKYMCQFAAASVLGGPNGTINDGADNSIIPGTFTGGDGSGNNRTYQIRGVSVTPGFTAFRGQVVATDNPTLAGGSNGVVPTSPAVSNPAAGATTATFSWTNTSPDVSYDVAKNGVVTQPNVTPAAGSTTSVTVSLGTGVATPHTDALQVRGYGTNGNVSAYTTAVSVTYTSATGGSAPGTPGIPAITGIGIGTATATVTPPTSGGAVTSYSFFVDGSSTAVTSNNPSVVLSLPAASGPHTVTSWAQNQYGHSVLTAASNPFTMSTGPDTTAPTPPGMPFLQPGGLLAYNSVPLGWAASTDPSVSGSQTSGLLGYPVMRNSTPDYSTVRVISTPSVNAFTDLSPIATPGQTTPNYYWIGALDNQGNAVSGTGPFQVNVPPAPLLVNATPRFAVTADSTPITINQNLVFDASQSLPGVGGAIGFYAWDFGDGTSAQPSTSPQVAHSYSTPGAKYPTLTIYDAAGNKVSTPEESVTVLVYPPGGAGFDSLDGTILLPDQQITAAGLMDIFDAIDQKVGDLSSAIGSMVETQAMIGNPSSPARHGLLWYSMPPELCGDQLTLLQNTAYVWRAWMADGSPFSSVQFNQVATGVSSTVSGMFFAVFDVSGNLMSPTGALSDASASFKLKGPAVYALDGGPYSAPLGDDALQDTPSNQFYVWLWSGNWTGTGPQLGRGSGYQNNVNLALNIGTTTPAFEIVDDVPLFSKGANSPSTALTPPATMGALTIAGDSLLIGLS